LIRVNAYFSLVLTATVAGEIGVWDFETSMLLALLNGHIDIITDM
jgi:hypothetical protein